MDDGEACHLELSIDRDTRSLTLVGNVAALEFIDEACSALANSRRTTSDEHFWITRPEEGLVTMVLDARAESGLGDALLVEVDETDAVLLVGSNQGLTGLVQCLRGLLEDTSTGTSHVIERVSVTPESWQLTMVFNPAL